MNTLDTDSPVTPPWAYRWSPNIWLAIGALLTILSGMRWGVSALAWIAPVPFLLYLRMTTGWRSRLLLALALQIAVNLQILKMITEPLPVVVAFAFGVPMALGTTALFLVWDALRRRLGDAVALYAFPAMVAVSEWLSYAYTDFGVWGAGANTQLHHLSLLQIASLVGVTGIGFLMAWTAAFIALLLATDKPRIWFGHGLALAGVLVGALGWGSARVFAAQEGPSAVVAG